MTSNTVYLVDAYAQIYRGYHAIKLLKTRDGRPSNALFSISKYLLALRKEFKPEFGAFIFDKGPPLERLTIYPQYKANRPKMPEDMRNQINPIRQLILAFGWKIIEKEGFEADDLIASLSRIISTEKIKIFTNDKDICQIVDDRVSILAVNSITKEIEERTPEKILKKYLVKPTQIVDYLAMVGDLSDNIPGLLGVGPKTAAKLLNEFGSIQNIYSDLSKLRADKLIDLFSYNKDLLNRNIKMITLNQEIEIEKVKKLSDLSLNKLDSHAIEKISADFELRALNSTINEIHKESTLTQDDLFNFYIDKDEK